jgi:hypothetical protein
MHVMKQTYVKCLIKSLEMHVFLPGAATRVLNVHTIGWESKYIVALSSL